MFNCRKQGTKLFDVIKLKSQPKTPEIQKSKSQPKTPEIQKLSFSLIKQFLVGQRNYHIFQYSENVLAIIKKGLE